MEGFHTLQETIQQGDWLFKIDLKSAYHHIPVHPAHRRKLAFMWDGEPWVFNALPFGLSIAPRIFTKVMKPVVAAMRQAGVRVIIYLDDMLFMAASEGAARTLSEKIMGFLTRLGLLVNLEKSILRPTQRIVFLGMEIDATRPSMGLTIERFRSLRTQLATLAWNPDTTKRELARMAGTIQSCRAGMTNAIFLSRPFLMVLKKWGRMPWNAQKRVVPPTLRLYATHLLKTMNRRPRSIILPTTEAILYTDSSSSKWGAMSTEPTQKILSEAWTRDEQALHINVKELLGLFRALKTAALEGWWPPLTLVRISVDSTVARANVLHNGGRNRIMSKIAADIALLAEKCRWQLTTQWVPSKENLADYLTRTSRPEEWKLSNKFFAKAQRKISFPLKLDLFASATTAQTDKFVSKTFHPNAVHVDALSLNWATLQEGLWMCPPVNLIQQCLHKIQREQPQAALITPEWPSRPWWPLLMELQPRRLFTIQSHTRVWWDPMTEENQLSPWNLVCWAFERPSNISRVGLPNLC
jgi:hypothetical protein